jgi:hypothetical protein
VPGTLEQLDVVLGRQVRREQLHAAQVELAPAQVIQDERIGSPGSRGLDAVIGRGLREVQNFGAVGEHRGAALLEVERAGVDLAEVGEELRLDLAVASDELMECAEQVTIGKACERGRAWRSRVRSGHGVCLDKKRGDARRIPRRISVFEVSLCRSNDVLDDFRS